MTHFRLIAPEWLTQKRPGIKKVLEGQFTAGFIKRMNSEGYNVYYLPNHPKEIEVKGTVSGFQINVFNYCFVDFDLKSNSYASKEAFIETLGSFGLPPSKIVDSGNGVHAYWKVSDLDAKSYLRLTRRLMRLFNTDEAVGQVFQLMRYAPSINTKIETDLKLCELLYESEETYTCEQLNKALPVITAADEAYCVQHYDKTYNLDRQNTPVNDTLPPKFGKLLNESKEAKSIWASTSDDRSKDDFRLGHLMFANDFTKEEAISVLVNSAKALARAPHHRITYAENIVDKIWTFEAGGPVNLSPTVRDLLSKGEDTLKGTRFPCNRLIDDTVHGFRLGQVIGIIGGSGVGKTTLTLNTFIWFASLNPDYQHFFFSLEQPPGEIASRIKTICQGDETLYDKIHIVSNYAEDGTFRHFSMKTIEKHLLDYQTTTGKKVGACVIDHIGVLAKSEKNGENEGLIGICREMKASAVKVNMMLIMLSQAPREKAGIGDLELDKSAAYGTVFFESFLDYCLCLWQPLKRAYATGAPTIMALKFAKIRHKKQGQDRIQEDVCYQFYFDPNTERLRELTQDEEISAKYYLNVATNLRKADKKTDIVPYTSRRVEEQSNVTTIDSDNQTIRH